MRKIILLLQLITDTFMKKSVVRYQVILVLKTFDQV